MRRAWTDPRIRLGSLLGASISLLIATTCRIGPERTHGPLLADCEGALDEIAIHYTRAAAPIVAPTYRAFLSALPQGVTVHVLVPERDDFDDLRSRLGELRCRLHAVVAGHPLTPWSRDRYLAFEPLAGGSALLLSPRAEEGAELWPERAGDERAGADLAAALEGVTDRRDHLAFDGGDFAADAQTAFVTPAVLDRNLGVAVRSAAQLSTRLETLLGREVVLLADSPEHHAGMFMMPIGERRVVVGDPALAEKLAGKKALELVDPDLRPETRRRFDAVARACERAGYRVLRAPVLPDRDGRSYLSYVNVVLDVRAGARTVYMPVYAGAETLNAAAAFIWRQAGYRVVPVDCTRTYRHAGSLRCLVNVLRRS
ncbi:MAG: agmatine deiminase family protein [Deltaproteobacteria bacterium]|nr:agmatine deiminase family protein [Deltaproteobacteria bacterium]